MHKRLLTAAIGIALGLLTTAANARTYDFDHNTWSAEDGDNNGRSHRSRQRHRSTDEARAERSDGENEGERIQRRSVTRDYHGGGGTSRTCLTSAARA